MSQATLGFYSKEHKELQLYILMWDPVSPVMSECFHLTFVTFCLLIVVCPFVLQHKDAYQGILDGVKGGAKEKRLAAQFIPKFFSSFPELADAAINAQLDLCEDEEVSVSTKLKKVSKSSALPYIASFCFVKINLWVLGLDSNV